MNISYVYINRYSQLFMGIIVVGVFIHFVFICNTFIGDKSNQSIIFLKIYTFILSQNAMKPLGIRHLILK